MQSISLTKSYALNKVLTVLAGVCIMILGSKISIPLYPVPITLQTAGMLFIAMTSLPYTSFLSVFFWLLLAAAGFPVLAGSTVSIATLTGPTAGYLWGMVLAVTAMSACQVYGAHFFNRIFFKNQSTNSTRLSMPAMILVAYLGSSIIWGLGWLNLSRYVGAWGAWDTGVAPFLIGDFFKIMSVSGIVWVLKLGHKSA